ncbi:MAG: hypothetical protein K2I30_05115 [Clostridia bacterium]|nr:hypothetical protein [Clostridia bacterium]
MKTILAPFAARRGLYSTLVQIARYVGVCVARSKHFKHFADDGRGFFVYDIILFIVDFITERNRTAKVFTF